MSSPNFSSMRSAASHCAQSLREGSAALGRLPREVQRQVEAHRKAGGVQHLLDLLRQIQVGFGSGLGSGYGSWLGFRVRTPSSRANSL